MPHALTIDVPEEVFLSLEKLASREGKTPEVIAQVLLARAVQDQGSDPVLGWIGAFESHVPDAAERHDFYLGEALANEGDSRGES